LYLAYVLMELFNIGKVPHAGAKIMHMKYCLLIVYLRN